MSLIYLVEEIVGKQKKKETMTSYTKRAQVEIEEKYGKRRVRLELNKIYRHSLTSKRISYINMRVYGNESTILLALNKVILNFKKDETKV